MFGSSDAVLVYGFNMGNREYIIDYDYLADVFPDISQYAIDVVKNCLGEAVYGISCALDNKTGQAIISGENKEKVKILYNKYVEYLKKHFTQKDFKKKMKEIQLCFRLAVSGDYETCHKKLILDEDWQEEEDEDDELDKEAEIVRNLFEKHEEQTDTSLEEINMTNMLNVESSEEDEIEQKTYRGVYYADAMDMEAAMRADAEKIPQLRHILEDDNED